MATNGYKRTLLTGGTVNALDSIIASSLSEDDFAFVFVDGRVRLYNYKNYGSPQTESSPDIIVPDTNPGNFAWELQETQDNFIIATNTTLHLATTGNDTTGDGSSATPWYSLEKVFDYLKDKWIETDVTVSISIGDGTYTGLNEVDICHPCSERIEISGFTEATTILTFTANGIVVTGKALTLIENLTIKGPAVSNIGLNIISGSVYEVSNVKFDTWENCCLLQENSFIDISNCDFYNFKYGLNVNQSNAKIHTTDFDANSVSASFGFYSNNHSEIISAYLVTFANMTTGCYATVNSFIDATGVSSNTASTPYNPTATTVESAEPTWGNWGSWIKD